MPAVAPRRAGGPPAGELSMELVRPRRRETKQVALLHSAGRVERPVAVGPTLDVRERDGSVQVEVLNLGPVSLVSPCPVAELIRPGNHASPFTDPAESSDRSSAVMDDDVAWS